VSERVCLLGVPTNKTTSVFTKPVDRIVGEAVEAWQAVRPAQPRFPDRKTGQLVDMLLAYRGAPLGSKYINRVLVPLLCRKAGVPREDVRGAITSHRARATIATQLYNAKDPMSLFELQAWLGHANPSSTQHSATSTSRNPPARRSCSRQSTGCSGCSSQSRSPMTSAPPSKATSRRSTA